MWLLLWAFAEYPKHDAVDLSKILRPSNMALAALPNTVVAEPHEDLTDGVGASDAGWGVREEVQNRIVGRDVEPDGAWFTVGNLAAHWKVPQIKSFAQATIRLA